MIPKDTIEKIKELADIVEVIGDFVDLKKSGSSFKGLSPFGNEKTPSFMVSPSKGIFKDFSSGKGGDSIKFLMELEGYSYLEAIKYLGRKYGVEIQEKEESPEQIERRTEKDSLFIILNFAKNFYRKILNEHDEGKSVALSYFYERGFSDQTINTFELGHSLNEWDSLIKEAKTQQHNVELLEKAGLVIRKEEKVYDRFRGRVIFPIHNVSGKVIGFGARILTNDKKQPKYINSPETTIYHKSEVLYGMFQSKNEIRNKENCYLVEGYTDVISLHQHGVKNVVASSGTALTKEQIRLIKRYSKVVTVLYDGDAAGIRASLRGIDLILEEGLDVKAVTFPEGEDPDSYIRAIGGEAFQEYLTSNAKDFITFKTNLFLSEAKNDPLKKAEVINEVIESIAKVPDAIKRSVFFKECSQLLDIDESLLITQYNKIIRGKERKEEKKQEQGEVPVLPEPVPEVKDLGLSSALEMEREIARILLHYSKIEVDESINLGKFIIEEVSDVEFRDEQIQMLIDHYKSAYAKEKALDLEELLHHEDDQIQQIAIDLTTSKYEVSENWAKFQIFVKKETDDIEQVVMRTIVRLKWRNVRLILKELDEKMKESSEVEEQIQLQEQFIAYKNMEMSLAKILGNVAVG